MRLPSGGPAAFVALLAGFIVGAVARAMHGGFSGALLAVTDPVGTLWVNAIRMTVVPLVVSLLVTGVASVSDVGTVGRLGVRALLIFLALLAGVSLLGFLLVPPVYAYLHVDPATSAALRERLGGTAPTIPDLPGFSAWLTGLVPVNPIKSAVDGAMLPLIVFTLAFAVALLRLPEGTRNGVLVIFQGIGATMLVLVRWLLAVSTIGIFALATSLGIRVGLSAAGAVGFYLVTHSLLLLFALVLLYPVVAIFGGVSISRFARAVLPAQAVAVGTRSSLAALPALIEGAEVRLQLPRAVTGFILPLGVSIFRISQGISWVLAAMFLARLYDVPFGMASAATLALTAIVMSFSVPGIPSGGLLVVAPFYAAIGLPMEGIGILIALDAIPDMFKTLLIVTGHMTSAVLLARYAPAEP